MGIQRPSSRAIIALIAAYLFLGGPSTTFAQNPQSYIETLQTRLRTNGYDATAEGLREYFADFQVDDGDRREIAQWIEMLGAPQYRVRESAMHSLLNRANTQSLLVNRLLRESLDAQDDEIRFRVRWLLARSSESGSELLASALQLISNKPLEGLADELVPVWPYCANDQLRTYFAAALKATSQADDKELLEQLLFQPESFTEVTESTRHLLQIAAIESLRNSLEQKCVDVLAPCLKNRHEGVRLAAAIALIDFTPLPAINTLIDLLSSDNPQICDRAFVILRHVTNQDIWVNAYGDRQQRAAAAKQWRKWFDSHAKSTKLKLPLEEKLIRQQRLLLAMFRPSKVLHCTIAGNTLDETTEVDTPSACAIRADGSRVIAEWSANGICEMDREGKVLRRHSLGSNPNGMDLLPNGNVLVALFNDNRVMEVTPQGKKVWEVEVDRAPTDIRRLPNGNTLVALHGTQRLIELNSKLQIVWSIGGLPSPEAARPLLNGNILIAGAKGVFEYNREGRMVWESGHGRPAYDAVFLDNGNVIIADMQDGVFEYTREGEQVRKITDGCVRRIFYY